MSLHSDAGYDPRERLSGPRPSRGRYRIPLVAGALLVLVSATAWYASGPGGAGDGPVPLIQADPSPVKIRPEQPGGMAIPHQDKLIFQRLNPGQPGPVVERLLPAPETPLPRPEAPAEIVAVEPDAAVPVVAPMVPAPLPETVALPSLDPVPLAGSGEQETVAVAQPLPPELPAAEPARPEPAAIVPPEPPPQPPPQPPQTGGAKGVRVQIASVRSEDVARDEFQRLQRRFPDALGSLGLTVVRTEIAGKGTYYRVQAGPVEEARANAICQTLKGQSVGCIVIRP